MKPQLSKFLSVVKHCGKALLHLSYPPICLHCGGIIEENSSVFCEDCLLQLELIDPKERCPCCFSSDFYPQNKICGQCIREAPVFDGVVAAFDYAGPAAELIKGMKYSNRPYLAKGAAAYLAAQLIHLDWPLPDIIIPAPIPITKWMQRGYNQSYLVGEQLSKFLNRPLCDALGRCGGDFSQAGQTRRQRLELQPSSFYLSKKVQLQDKCVLLVDDVITTGSTLRCCAETVAEGCPGSIYGAAVCCAI